MLVAAAILLSCQDHGDNPLVGPTSVLQTSLLTGEAPSVITAFYMGGNGWVRLASWDGAYLPTPLKICFDAWNWPPVLSGFWAEVDNFVASGDLDFAGGLQDDFSDAVIASYWQPGHSPGAPSPQAANGALHISIPAGAQNVAGLCTGKIVHGLFDAQLDYEVSPNFHLLYPGTGNLKLIVLGDQPAPMAEVSVRVGTLLAIESSERNGYVRRGRVFSRASTGSIRLARRAAVQIDIKPGDGTNRVNPGSRGMLPVAVLTTEHFDAADIDVASLTLGNEVGAETPVALKPNGDYFAALEDIDDDGDLDLVVKFRIPALVAAGDLSHATAELVLQGHTKIRRALRGRAVIQGSA